MIWVGLGVLLAFAAVAVFLVARADSRVPVPPPSAVPPPAPVPTPAPRPVAAPVPTPPPAPAAAPVPTPPPAPVAAPVPTPRPRPSLQSLKISAEVAAEIVSLNHMGRPISALKVYRDATGASLAEAKAAIASLMQGAPPPEFPPEAPPPPPEAAAPATPPAPAPAPATPPPSAAPAASAEPAPPAPAPAPEAAPAAPAAPEEYFEEDEEIRALVHFDRMEDAVKLYRHVHQVDLKTAQAAVNKMAPHGHLE